MAVGSLDNQLQQYWQLLEQSEKQSVMEVIKSFLKLKEPVQPIERISTEQYNKEIDEAVVRVESGQYYTQEEVDATAKRW